MSAEFDAFFRSSYPSAVALARRMLGSWPAAEDTAAEAFARALVHWRRLAAADHRDAWVLRTTANLAIDQLRHDGRSRASRSHTVDDGAEGRVDDRLIALHLLAALPRRQREVVVLRHLAGLPESEVALALGIAPSSVKTHLKRAMTRLHASAGDWS